MRSNPSDYGDISVKNNIAENKTGFASNENNEENDSPGPLNVGIISPYSFETAGGVQFHIRDYAEELISRGHSVKVLAPGKLAAETPDFVETAGSSISVHYNGSVANLSGFGFSGSRARKWIKQNDFDIVHLHEPGVPSLSHKALFPGFNPCPFVATFHAAFDEYPTTLKIAEGYLRMSLEKLSAAICVSPAAAETSSRYLPKDLPVSIIPNGIKYDTFAKAKSCCEWKGTPDSPTVGFLGRMGEPRKGFEIFARAAQKVTKRFPNARFLCAGSGEGQAKKILASLNENARSKFEFLGRISDSDKAKFYSSLSAYIAPQTGGESFGIVLAEAMSAGCPVIASDIRAFADLSENGQCAQLFKSGSSNDLADKIIMLLSDENKQEALKNKGAEYSKRFDWRIISEEVVQIYRSILLKSQ